MRTPNLLLFVLLISSNEAKSQMGVGDVLCDPLATMPYVGTNPGVTNASSVDGTVTFLQDFNGSIAPKFNSIDYFALENYPCLATSAMPSTQKAQIANGLWQVDGSMIKHYALSALLKDPTSPGIGKFIWNWTKINDLASGNFYNTTANRIGLLFGTDGVISIPVIPGKQYKLSVDYWADNGNTPIFQFYIGNNTMIGSVTGLNRVGYVWNTAEVLWVCPPGVTSTYININDVRSSGGGHDFAYDNVKLTLLGDPINLPIELVNFDAKLSPQETVDLTWVTSSERDNDYFTVEKSMDGISWTEVGIVGGAGNSSTTKNYELEDDNPSIGMSYYKLKQTDFNGHSTYSEIRSVERYGMNEYVLFPNPAENSVVLFNINNDFDEISICDNLGEILTFEKNILSKNEIEINTSSFANGIYYINILSKSKIHILKLTVLNK